MLNLYMFENNVNVLCFEIHGHSLKLLTFETLVLDDCSILTFYLLIDLCLILLFLKMLTIPKGNVRIFVF